MKHVLSRESSKFALHTAQEVHRIGHYSEHEGCNFSNLNFLPVKKYSYAWSKTLLPYSSNNNSILQQEDVWELYGKLKKLFEEYSKEYYHYLEEINDVEVVDACCEFSQYLHLMYDIILSTSEAIELDEYMDAQFVWEDSEVQELNPFDV